MTITLPLDPIAAFATEHLWPIVTLVFLIGVVLPAIWSTRPWRRHAAMAVMGMLLGRSRPKRTATPNPPRRR
ncbi:MAG: hypothetical protein JO272_17225 [Pseudonocardiales bacterium]|nr:hypothetical protein [Pseudonocardiales bacterium]